MAFSQIQSTRLSDKVVQVIMDMITDGTLKAGDRLPNENELAEQLNVSRGVLREALIILQARDYILRKPKDGTFINTDILNMLNKKNGISLKEATFLDMIEMRECIEQKVVEKIIDNATETELEEVVNIVKGIKEEKEKKSPDYYFHYHLAELSKNAMFMNFIDTYYDVINELKMKTTKNIERESEINEEHLEIAEALLCRNKTEAKNAVLQHLSNLKKLAMDREKI